MTKSKKKHFLVTGGLGFIGSNIVKLLIRNGYNVTVFDNSSRGKIKKLGIFKSKVKIISGDIKNFKSTSRAFKNIDAVIHLAYINGTKYFYSKPIEVLDVAVKGIVNILDISIKKKIKEIYLASSSEVYQTPTITPTSEKEMLKVPDIYNPRYSYGTGKILTEVMGINYGRKYFNKLVIFRPHNVYGPDMGEEHVIPELIYKTVKTRNNHIVLKGTGKEIRSFIYIDDFIGAFNYLLAKGKHLEVYNIGTNEAINTKKLAKIISSILSKNCKIKSSPIPVGGTKIRNPSIQKIKELGFKPKISLKEGLKKTINFYIKNQKKKGV